MNAGADHLLPVTLVSPGYELLAREAVRRVRRFTGLEPKVLRCARGTGFDEKLRLDLRCGRRRVLFFDADWWLLRDWPQHAEAVPQPLGAVHDAAVWDAGSFPARDCRTFGLDRTRYFNTGLMLLDFRDEEQRELFRLARRFAAKGRMRAKMTDPTDQGWLNVAAHELKTPMQRMPLTLNFYLAAALWGCVPNIPRRIYGIHAAAVPREHKLAALRAQAATFGQRVGPMQPEALAARHAMTEELQ